MAVTLGRPYVGCNSYGRREDETIYQVLYSRGRGGLSRELVKFLRTSRYPPQTRQINCRRSSRFAGDVLMTSDRPRR